MGIEYQEPVQIEADAITERSLDKMTGLETEVGLNGALLAVAVDLTKGGAIVHLDAIISTLNRRGLTKDQAVALLLDAKFRRVRKEQVKFTNRIEPIEDETGEYWIRPAGKEDLSSWGFTKDDGQTTTLNEERITQLVNEHMLERPSVDFGFGGESELAKKPIDSPEFKGAAVVEDPSYVWADWGHDDPPGPFPGN